MNDHLVDHGFLTARDRAEENGQQEYEKLTYEVEEELRIEWEEEFGLDSRFPFKPNSKEVHDEVMRRMK